MKHALLTVITGFFVGLILASCQDIDLSAESIAVSAHPAMAAQAAIAKATYSLVKAETESTGSYYELPPTNFNHYYVLVSTPDDPRGYGRIKIGVLSDGQPYVQAEVYCYGEEQVRAIRWDGPASTRALSAGLAVHTLASFSAPTAATEDEANDDDYALAP